MGRVAKEQWDKSQIIVYASEEGHQLLFNLKSTFIKCSQPQNYWHSIEHLWAQGLHKSNLSLQHSYTVPASYQFATQDATSFYSSACVGLSQPQKAPAQLSGNSQLPKGIHHCICRDHTQKLNGKVRLSWDSETSHGANKQTKLSRSGGKEISSEE